MIRRFLSAISLQSVVAFCPQNGYFCPLLSLYVHSFLSDLLFVRNIFVLSVHFALCPPFSVRFPFVRNICFMSVFCILIISHEGLQPRQTIFIPSSEINKAPSVHMNENLYKKLRLLSCYSSAMECQLPAESSRVTK